MIEDRDERIRQRAYRIWEEEGRPEGREEEHWHRAAREIESEDREDFGDDDARGLQTQRLTETGDGGAEPALSPEAGGAFDGAGAGAAESGGRPKEPGAGAGQPAASASRRRRMAGEDSGRGGATVGRG